MSPTYGLILTTIGSQSEAKALAEALVSDRLAACVQLIPVESVYRWEGAVQCEPEVQVVIKTDLALFDRVEARIRSLHSYELPEIVAVPIVAGSVEYLGWIGASVRAGEV
jgi:periplasmic divalent cation tolerance protein